MPKDHGQTNFASSGRPEIDGRPITPPVRQAYTQYWSERTFTANLQVGGEALDHTAGSEFTARGISSGDLLFLVSIVNGQMAVLSRGVVDAVVDFEKAVQRLGNPHLYEAPEHVLFRPGTSIPLAVRLLPAQLATELRFVTTRGDESGLTFTAAGKLDPQTLRTVRRLTPESAERLDGWLLAVVVRDKLAADASESQREEAIAEARAALDAAELDAFDPTSANDARRHAWRSIALRRGQTAFRQALLNAYAGRCCVSGCEVTSVLEAAHIVPYRGEATNHVQNGLLLRADLHTLFDLGLLDVNPETFCVVLAPELVESEYAAFKNKPITLPLHEEQRPARDAFEARRAIFRRSPPP